VQDENAFGLLISYLNLEDHELFGERSEFIERYRQFAGIVRERLARAAPGASGRAVELGHAVYIEILEDAREGDLIAWLRETRAALSEHGYETAAMLTFAGSWIAENEPRPAVTDVGSFQLVQASLPSEPLRRALLADAAARFDEATESAGWGPGLYLDVEAVEALGRKPKNAPSVLRAGDATFYRAGT
jgi:hypothetical protein